MPPKSKKKADKGSKKSEQKKKDKQIEDKTFGLKNKNKSKKVQAFVTSVQRNVMNSGDPKQRKLDEERKKKKIEQKARKKAMDDEKNALFNDALMAVSKKKGTDKKSGKVQAAGRDGNEDTKKSGTSRAMKMMYQMDAKEMEDKLKEDPNYVPTLEDEIESQRQKKIEELKKAGKKGTPVTEKSFKEWIERKRKQRAAAAKKLVEQEMRKKKGGKGLAVLSGRDLFEYKRDLFKDDELEDDTEVNATAEADSDLKQKAEVVDEVATKVEEDLFLEGDDEDLDDLDDIDDDE
mmetsp:Transcript_16691/g.23195  ORF Transcript_16691/g.23195 Transcript_16691/m.23195 type:complete len:291 (+) Transcript_16691:174-1046(+)